MQKLALKLSSKRTGSDAEQESAHPLSLVPVKKRPRHRVGAIPFCGKSFDALDMLPAEIRRQEDSVQEMRHTASMQPDYSRSFFVRFTTQMDA